MNEIEPKQELLNAKKIHRTIFAAILGLKRAMTEMVGQDCVFANAFNSTLLAEGVVRRAA